MHSDVSTGLSMWIEGLPPLLVDANVARTLTIGPFDDIVLQGNRLELNFELSSKLCFFFFNFSILKVAGAKTNLHQFQKLQCASN